MRPTVLLFDIDGTLITTGGAGRRALERAFEVHAGRKDACSHFRFDGMTDRAIARRGLQAIGHEPTERAIDALLAAYVEVLEDEVARAPVYRIHDGMGEALDRTAGNPLVAVGLGTGNIRVGATVKLRRVGLDVRFAFGGFGCDHESRIELIRIGADRGADHLRVPRGSCRVVVVGDTPSDIAAAKGIGAESVGVGTGSFRPEQLLACGASAAFPSLASPGAIEALLGP